VLFPEETPYELIGKIHPDVLVKGEEYQLEEIAGHNIVLADGGKVERIKLTEGFSTTSLIEKIKNPDGTQIKNHLCLSKLRGTIAQMGRALSVVRRMEYLYRRSAGPRKTPVGCLKLRQPITSPSAFRKFRTKRPNASIPATRN
jgi:hypothetical protein